MLEAQLNRGNQHLETNLLGEAMLASLVEFLGHFFGKEKDM